MKLSSFFASLACVAAASLASARPTAREACGEGGTIVNSTTIHHEGKEFAFTTKTCSNLEASSNATVAKPVDDSDGAYCDSWSCSVNCVESAIAQPPSSSDCQYIENVLNSQPAGRVFTCLASSVSLPSTPGTYFTAPSGTISSFAYNTCAYAFVNRDTVIYNPCVNWLSHIGDFTFNYCFRGHPTGYYTAGYCARNDVQSYAEVYNPTSPGQS
ncbi:hypothetical protein EWM64_g7395 [Hericium alpestre]|uniref:Uncharacterized protein n=1 Tax=Hericium alpestre TaxID=135208 RepID=A0A4Y9ZRE5_9AGAM|nr:hypothetical protein EWM64_g7395 [Hericium alpestre]